MEKGIVLQNKVRENLSPRYRGRWSSQVKVRNDGDHVNNKKPPTIWQQMNKKFPVVKSA